MHLSLKSCINKNRFASQNYNNTNSLYELIKEKDIYEQYKKILKCAARFNVTPSWANSKKEMERSYNFNIAMNNKPELIQL